MTTAAYLSANGFSTLSDRFCTRAREDPSHAEGRKALGCCVCALSFFSTVCKTKNSSQSQASRWAVLLWGLSLDRRLLSEIENLPFDRRNFCFSSEPIQAQWAPSQMKIKE
mmetsp:Transcript_22490/g.51849  ORF Transcript_22490/g.51849 Transcript_22490/m.51849 type:complete len:111 (-) Transcript_22490:249-581(-)